MPIRRQAKGRDDEHGDTATSPSRVASTIARSSRPSEDRHASSAADSSCSLRRLAHDGNGGRCERGGGAFGRRWGLRGWPGEPFAWSRGCPGGCGSCTDGCPGLRTAGEPSWGCGRLWESSGDARMAVGAVRPARDGPRTRPSPFARDGGGEALVRRRVAEGSVPCCLQERPQLGPSGERGEVDVE